MKRRDFLLTTAALAGAPALPQTNAKRQQPANSVRSVTPVHQRRGGQALVQRPRDVAALPHHAGRAALQPLQPRLRHRLRFPARRHRRLLPVHLSVPAFRARLQRARRRPADAERDRNLEMLRFISEQTAARGLEFQLGFWMHGYQWIDSPHANYTIEGLNAENHGAVLPRCAWPLCCRPVPRSAA